MLMLSQFPLSYRSCTVRSRLGHVHLACAKFDHVLHTSIFLRYIIAAFYSIELLTILLYANFYSFMVYFMLYISYMVLSFFPYLNLRITTPRAPRCIMMCSVVDHDVPPP